MLKDIIASMLFPNKKEEIERIERMNNDLKKNDAYEHLQDALIFIKKILRKEAEYFLLESNNKGFTQVENIHNSRIWFKKFNEMYEMIIQTREGKKVASFRIHTENEGNYWYMDFIAKKTQDGEYKEIELPMEAEVVNGLFQRFDFAVKHLNENQNKYNQIKERKKDNIKLAIQ